MNLTIEIPPLKLSNDDFRILKANLVYLETPECRTKLSKEFITDERRRLTHLFRLHILYTMGLTEGNNNLALM